MPEQARNAYPVGQRVRHLRVGLAVALAALTGTYILADPVDDGVEAGRNQLGQDAIVLNGLGGVNTGGSDGLKIVLNGTTAGSLASSTAADQVYFANTRQYCCAAVGPMLNIGGTLYGEAGAASSSTSFSSLEITNRTGSAKASSETQALGSGSVRLSYTVVRNGLTYSLTRDVAYVYPNDYFTNEYTLAIPAGNTENVRFYFGGDTAPGSSDTGYGVEVTSPVRSTISLNPNTRIQVGFREISGDKPFDGATSQRYSAPYTAVQGGNDIGFVTTAANHDAGLMMQWNFGSTPGTYQAAMEVFSNFQGTRLNAAFDRASEVAGGDVDLDLTIVNTVLSQATGLGFELSLPTGLTVSGSPVGTCGGSVSTSTGSNTIGLSNGTVSGAGSCLISVPVLSATPGVFTLSAQSVSSTSGGLVNGVGSATVEMTGAPEAPTNFTDDVIGDITAGTPFVGQISANGYPAPTYTVTAGSLPNSLTINAATGEISGTAPTQGMYSFEITATNSAGSLARTFSGTVLGPPAAPVWTDTSLAAIETNSDYSDGVSASGSPSPTYAVSAGSLPAGLVLNATTGAITGRPTTAGPYDFTVRASNSQGVVTHRVQGSVAVGATAPEAPASLQVASVTGGGFDITFDAPADGGSVILRYEYRVDSGLGFSNWSTANSPNSSTVRIGSLAESTQHTTEIRAVNAIGNGPAAAIAVATPARSLTVTAASTSILVGSTTTLSHAVDVGAGTVTYAAAGPCTVSGTTVTATGAGTCTITGTISTDSTTVSGVTYSSVTGTETVSISLETQSPLTVTNAPSSLDYGLTVDLGSSGGSGSGAVTFDAGSSNACTVDAATGVVTMTAGTGTCDITATKASTYRFSSVTSGTVSITPSPAAVTVTGPTPAAIAYGDPVPVLQPVYAGLVGSDTGVTGVSCSTVYDPTDPSARGVGTHATSCAITGSDPNYAPTFQPGNLVVAPAPLTVAGPSPSVIYGATPASSFTPTMTGFVFDEGVNDLTTAPSCTTTADATSDVGTYSITCAGGAATNYSFTYTSGVFTIGKAAQTALTITTRTSDATLFDTGADTAVYGQRLTLSTGGGSGTGTITHSVGASNACTVTTADGVTSIEITAGVGTCTIITTKAADTNHLVTATSTTIDVGPATLRRPGAPTVVAVNPTTVRVGIPQVTGASSHTVRLLAGTTTVSTINVAAGTSSVTFSDLTPDTIYTATVTAISASDNWVTSDASPSTDTTTPAPQAPPRSTNTSQTASIQTVAQTPTLLTESDAPRIAQGPGTGGGTAGSGTLDVVVRTLVADPAIAAAVATPPTERTPEQVTAIQTAARDLANDFDTERPAGVAPLFTVIDTPTGVVIRGLYDTGTTNGDTGPTDPTSTQQIRGDVPFENAIILETADSMMVLAAVDPTGQPIALTPDGVLEIYGATVAAAAYGFEPNATGEVIIFSTPRLVATFATDDYGAFLGEFAVPTTLEPGDHTLVFTTPDFTKTLGIRVAEPDRMLPNTGADTDGVLPWLILLTALGGFVWISSTGRDRPRRTLA